MSDNTDQSTPPVVTYQGNTYILLDEVMRIIDDLSLHRETNQRSGLDMVCETNRLHNRLERYYVIQLK